jgi:hypothetical protein
VTDLTWESWGKDPAIGHGMALTVPKDGAVPDAEVEMAEVIAFDLGRCSGSSELRYRKCYWFLPGQGENFDRDRYIDICSGEFIRHR